MFTYVYVYKCNYDMYVCMLYMVYMYEHIYA